MSKIRVYEVARELGLENRELLSKIASLGIQVRNHMSSIDPGDLDRLKRALDKEKQQNVVEERIRPTVVRRRVVGRTTTARSAKSSDTIPSAKEPSVSSLELSGKKPNKPSKMASVLKAKTETEIRLKSDTQLTQTPVSEVQKSSESARPPSLKRQEPAQKGEIKPAVSGERSAGRPERSESEKLEAEVLKPKTKKSETRKSKVVKLEDKKPKETTAVPIPKKEPEVISPMREREEKTDRHLIGEKIETVDSLESKQVEVRQVEKLPIEKPPVDEKRSAEKPLTDEMLSVEKPPVSEKPSVERLPVDEKPPVEKPKIIVQESEDQIASTQTPSAEPRSKVLPTTKPPSEVLPSTNLDQIHKKTIPTHPPSYEERLGSKVLPPGVVARGKRTGVKAAPLTAEERSRIVTEHAEQRRTIDTPVTSPPRRRELARAAIGPTGRQQQKARPGRPGRAKKPAPGKKTLKTELTVPSAQKRVIRIEDQIGLQTLAQRMSLKATEVLMKLMQLGMTGVMINSTLDADTAKIVASEFGFEVENVAISYDEFISEARGDYKDDDVSRVSRSPVVTVMGHVDHGKTSLLDKIRKTNVVAKESGGITQHLGAYRVDTKKGNIVFLDTPGHAAFTAMRARGAQATDVVILVVAADDGVMPQTKEAIDHAKAANVPIVVAINKIDKAEARPDNVMRDLANHGLQPEEWGGETIFVKVSATTGEGIDSLLESVILQAEMLELRANPDIPAQGVVLESYVDKGRGPVANLLVRDGTLKTGSFVVAGSAFGRIRAITDDRGKQTSKAGPATPIEVLGLSEIPDTGDPFDVVTDAKVAQQVAERRKSTMGKAAASTSSKIALDQLLSKMKESEVAELKLVIKADVQGSAEALVKALSEISSDKVKVNVIHSGVGGITESDIMLASASDAIVIGFRVRPTGGAVKVSKSEQVEIRSYNVIYDVIDDVKSAMAGLLKPEFVEKAIGKAEVRQVFNLTKGKIAGCIVIDGKLSRSCKVRLVRDSVQVWEGNIKSLRRIKDDVKEVASGLECGVSLENFQDIKENDVVECFIVEEVVATL